MKKGIISIIIIIALVVSGWLIEGYMLHKTNYEMTQYLNTIQTCLENENYDLAKSLHNEMTTRWEKTDNYLAVFISHDKINHISNQCAILLAYISKETRFDALACVAQLKTLFFDLSENMDINLVNIF